MGVKRGLSHSATNAKLRTLNKRMLRKIFGIERDEVKGAAAI